MDEKSKTSKIERDLLNMLIRGESQSYASAKDEPELSREGFVERLTNSLRPHNGRAMAIWIYLRAVHDANKGSGAVASLLLQTQAEIFALLYMHPATSRAIETVHDLCGYESALEVAGILYSIIRREKYSDHAVLDVSHTLAIVAEKKPYMVESAIYSINISKGHPNALALVTAKIREDARRS